MNYKVQLEESGMCLENKLVYILTKKFGKNNLKLQEISNGIKLEDSTKIIEKKFWGDDNYKFLEKTVWDNEKEKCVAIGFNPTKNSIENIDNSNKKIIKCIKEYKKNNESFFGGYYLLNLYPQRSNNKDEFSEDDSIGEKYHSLLPTLLSILIKKNIHVVVFWGRTVSVDNGIIALLKILQQKGKLLLTCKVNTNEHYHPARVNIQIVAASDNFYETSNIITGDKSTSYI